MLKTLLVHLAGSAGDEDVLTAAKHMASPFAAHLDCIHIRPVLGGLIAQAVRAGSDEDTLVISERVDALRRNTKESTRQAHHTYTEFCKREGIPHFASPTESDRVTAAWHEKYGRVAACLIAEARSHDLVVLAGGGMSDDAMSAHDLGDVILGSGRPVLLAPAKPSSGPIRTIAIAWKDAPEAARAVTAAMPLLSIAKRIVLLSANEENQTAQACVECADSVVRHLRWHGFMAEARYVIPAGRSLPDAVLETAHETGADLLVMGAYGRSRLGETIFGGFTQRMLAGAELPVFLFH